MNKRNHYNQPSPKEFIIFIIILFLIVKLGCMGLDKLLLK